MRGVFFKCLLGWIIASVSAAQALPQQPKHDLVAVLLPLDQQIFEAAFLTCDEDVLRELLSEDLEFYHDLYGMIAGDIDTFLAGTIPDCVARSEGQSAYTERRLIPGSMEVRRIGDWGAIQTGEHTFYGRDDEGQDIFLERGTFMHIWQNTRSGWRSERGISYDHTSE